MTAVARRRHKWSLARIICTPFGGIALVCALALIAPSRAQDGAGIKVAGALQTSAPSANSLAVWQALNANLRAGGWTEKELPRAEDLQLPPTLPSLAGEKLRAVSGCWDEGPRRGQFRLECVESGQCLPFLVYVPAADADSADAMARRIANSCGAAAGAHRAIAASRPPAPGKPVVRPGEKATVVLVSDQFRMAASVVCLDRGREGEIVRVRGGDGRVFRARVSGPARLEALPLAAAMQ